MKDYVIKKRKNATYVVNIKEGETIYKFDGVSKLIIDNIDKSENEILYILESKYKNVPISKIRKDYYSFIKDLELLNICSSNIENIVISNSDEKLKNASIEILNSCSFKCDHCYISNDIKYINSDIYKEIINQLVELNCDEILITGGEPMLHKDFIEMYLYAKKMGLMVSINSNISLLNNTILDTLCEYKPKVIEVSIYGYDNNSYLKFTHIDNAYTIVDNNIKKLIQNNIIINLKTVLTKRNKNYIYKMKKYANDINVPFRFDYIIFPNQDKISENLERCSIKEIIEVLKEDQDTINFFKYKVKQIQKNSFVNNNIFQCSIGSERIFISSNLDLRPCLVVPFKYNFLENNIREAYYSFKKIILNYKYQNEDKCKYCNKKSICRYCPGKFYMETGSFENVPEFYCKLADEIIKEFS